LGLRGMAFHDVGEGVAGFLAGEVLAGAELEQQVFEGKIHGRECNRGSPTAKAIRPDNRRPPGGRRWRRTGCTLPETSTRPPIALCVDLPGSACKSTSARR